jgi:hypothetical protein
MWQKTGQECAQTPECKAMDEKVFLPCLTYQQSQECHGSAQGAAACMQKCREIAKGGK